jgi:hypothetical protein
MAFKDSRCPACDILEGKRLQADSIHSFIHFPTLTLCDFFTVEIRFTDSLALLAEAGAFDQLTLLTRLTRVLC